MSHLLVGPLADMPKQMCLKSLENFCFTSFALSSLIISSGCVDIISPNSGFSTHSHSNMEIITIVLKGEITHRDSLNNLEIISEDEIHKLIAKLGHDTSQCKATDEDYSNLYYCCHYNREKK